MGWWQSVAQRARSRGALRLVSEAGYHPPRRPRAHRRGGSPASRGRLAAAVVRARRSHAETVAFASTSGTSSGELRRPPTLKPTEWVCFGGRGVRRPERVVIGDARVPRSMDTRLAPGPNVPLPCGGLVALLDSSSTASWCPSAIVTASPSTTHWFRSPTAHTFCALGEGLQQRYWASFVSWYSSRGRRGRPPATSSRASGTRSSTSTVS